MINGKNYSLKVIKNDQMVNSTRTHSLRIFLKNLRSINWTLGGIKVYMRVSYGFKLNHKNKMETFHNDGWYENEKDLLFAFGCFNKET
jgi:hypothetical protein